jgi:tetratricopeptide (TPR) repeat protein
MQVDKQEKDYKDTSELITKIQERMQLEALAGQAREFYDIGLWSDAIEVWNRVLETDPNYPDAVRAQLDAKYALAKALLKKKEWLQVINLVDEILKADSDYPNAINLKLDALFERAKVAYDAEQWPEALATLDPLLNFDPKYPQAAALKNKVRASQNWDRISRMVRKRLVQYPHTLWVLLLICIGAVALLWNLGVTFPSFGVTPTPVSRQIEAAEVLINKVKIDPTQPQNITREERIEIKVQAIDAAGAPIPNDEIKCDWSFIPTPAPTDFRTTDGCTINYQIPADMDSQSVLEEIKGQENTSITGVLRTSIKFVLK